MFRLLSLILFCFVMASFIHSNAHENEHLSIHGLQAQEQSSYSITSARKANSQIPINLVFYGTGYNEYTKITIVLKSVLFNRNPKHVIHVYILTDQYFRSRWKRHFLNMDAYSHTCVKIFIIPLAENLRDGPVQYFMTESNFKTFHYSAMYALSKLFLTEGLPSDVDRALFLDTDLLVLTDLMQLWQSFDDSKFYGVTCWYDLQRIDRFCRGRVGELCSKDLHWCNTGVMLVNLKRIRLVQNYTQWLVDTVKPVLAKSVNPFILAADTIMNIIAAKRADELYYLGCKYNCDSITFKRQDSEEKCRGERCAIVHLLHKNYQRNEEPGQFFAFFWTAYKHLDLQHVLADSSTCPMSSPNASTMDS